MRAPITNDDDNDYDDGDGDCGNDDNDVLLIILVFHWLTRNNQMHSDKVRHYAEVLRN